MNQASGHAASVLCSVTQSELLAMKVSAILESRPAALEVLVTHGFAPLKQPHLRAVLAPSVTLAQALRIRSLTAAEEQVLVGEILALFNAAVFRDEVLSGEVAN